MSTSEPRGGPVVAGHDRPPRLVAELALPDGRLRVGAGEAHRLPDDPRHVAALLGEDRARAHRITLDGRRLDRRAPAMRVRAGLVAVGAAPVAPGVAVVDHLAATLRRDDVRELLADVPRLADLAGRPAGVLSGGERRLLAWALALARTPAVMLLDRAGTGLDPDAQEWATRTVFRWRDAGVGVLVRVGRSEELAWLAPTVERPG
jgi:ABC-type branched-subunit amino acid transport system ATPase component